MCCSAKGNTQTHSFSIATEQCELLLLFKIKLLTLLI